MIEYPKMLSAFVRDEVTHKMKELNDNVFGSGDIFQWKSEAFGLINSWYVTEKLHGQNVRVFWDGLRVTFGARKAGVEGLPKELLEFLQVRFTPARCLEVFGETAATIFGEGVGPGIQANGATYSKEKAFVMFDVFINGFWLEPPNMEDVATKFGVQVAPQLVPLTNSSNGLMTIQEIVDLVRDGFYSPLSQINTGAQRDAEGIVARTYPALTDRHGNRIMFKLKTHDFALQPTDKRLTDAMFVAAQKGAQ